MRPEKRKMQERRKWLKEHPLQDYRMMRKFLDNWNIRKEISRETRRIFDRSSRKHARRFNAAIKHARKQDMK